MPDLHSPDLPTTGRFSRTGAFRLALTAEVLIAAPPQRIWAVLTDFASYARWSSVIPQARGQAVQGSMLDVDIHWPGLRRGPYRLQLTSVRAPRELRWLGRFKCRGLMDGDHRFTLAPGPAGTTRVTQYENFSGVLVPLFAPWLTDNVLRGFGILNDELKQAAENPDPNALPGSPPDARWLSTEFTVP